MSLDLDRLERIAGQSCLYGTSEPVLSDTTLEHWKTMVNELKDQGAELKQRREEAEWIRIKLGLPADTSTSDLYGKMHVICSHAYGYEMYIVAHKCDDKQGEIARQSVRIQELEHELATKQKRC